MPLPARPPTTAPTAAPIAVPTGPATVPTAAPVAMPPATAPAAVPTGWAPGAPVNGSRLALVPVVGRLVVSLAMISPDGGKQKRCVVRSAARSTCSAAAEQIDDAQKDDCADQRHEHRRKTEGVLVDGGHADERRDEPTAEQRADDADDDVQDHALLRVGPHDHACQPTDDSADYQPDDEVHIVSSPRG